MAAGELILAAQVFLGGAGEQMEGGRREEVTNNISPERNELIGGRVGVVASQLLNAGRPL